MIKKFTLIFLFIFLIFTLSCIEKIPTPFTEKFEETYPIEKETSLSIENFNGSVTITKWNENNISIFAEKKSLLGKGELNNVKIEIIKNDQFKINSIKLTKNPQVSITYNIKVPDKVILNDIVTSNGSIEIVDLRGDSNLKSSNGYIKVIGHSGNIRCDTSNGRIEITNLIGNATLNTSNGRIVVDGCERLTQVETSNATVEIRRTKEVGDIKTSNGKIEVDIYKIREGGARIYTSNGSIYANIKSDLNISLEVETSNGKIDVKDLDLSVDTLRENYLKGKLNSGGETVSIKTSNANIYLSALP
ncbi:MAG: DUF4097 family beta strand repeat-containing protein [Caldisericia bacterium]